MVYHIHRSSRIARAPQSETSSYTYIRRTRLEMESVERHLGERDPADNPAVGFRQTSPSYRIGDPFGNEFAESMRGAKKRERESEWWGGRGEGWARVKARLWTSRSCRQDWRENRGWTEKERTRESLSGQMIPGGWELAAILHRENRKGKRARRQMGWSRRMRNKKGGRKEKRDTLKGFPASN